jgi:hypothetical protein
MKIRVSKKEIREGAGYIIGVPYCDLQYLLRAESADYYSAGVYGWSCDYYNIKEVGVVISTGYDYIGKRADYELVKKYNNKASKMWDESKDYYKTAKQVHKLLLKFIEEVKK